LAKSDCSPAENESVKKCYVDLYKAFDLVMYNGIPGLLEFKNAYDELKEKEKDGSTCKILQTFLDCVHSPANSPCHTEKFLQQLGNFTEAEADWDLFGIPSFEYLCKTDTAKAEHDQLNSAWTNTIDCLDTNWKKLSTADGMTEDKLQKEMTCKQANDYVSPCPANEKDPVLKKHHCVFSTLMFDIIITDVPRLADCKYECGEARNTITKLGLEKLAKKT